MKTVLDRPMGWSRLLVLSFLFTNRYIQCNNVEHSPNSEDVAENVSERSNKTINDQLNDRSLGSEDDNHQQQRPTERGIVVSRYDATSNRSNLPEFQRYTCLESTKDYDCVFKNVLIDGRNNTILFGSSNAKWNNQTSLTFVNATMRSLPRTLVDTFENMERLNLEHLEMQTIERYALENGRKIKQLYLSYNNITSLDPGVFDNLVALERFVMKSNNLSTIPNGLFKNSKRLMTLSLAKNNLHRLEDNTFVRNTRLYAINATNNQLDHFDLRHIRNVFVVDVTNNKLRKLDIPVKMGLLYASHNEINEVTGKHGNKLRLLFLSHNKLKATAWLQTFTKIEVLDLSHNMIEDITSKDFKQLQRLTKLKLNNNRLFTIQIANNELMKSLKVLDLSHNELTYVEHNQNQFEQLEELFLDHNKIVNLKPRSMWPKVKNITLAYNDWDCANMENIIQRFPTNLSTNFHAETRCNFERLPQGLCCKRVEMPYYDRLKTAIAQVSRVVKEEAREKCPMPIIPPVPYPPLPWLSPKIDEEIKSLKIACQRLEQNLRQIEDGLNRAINRMDELTRMYRIRKTGLMTPSENLRKIFDHFKQRNELMANETIAYHNNANDKKEELDRMQSEVQQLEAILEAKRNLLEKYHQNQMLQTSG